MLKALPKKLSMVAMLALGASQTHAAHIDLALSGLASQVNIFSQDAGGTHFDIYDLQLTGLPDALTLNVLDTITATITLDQTLTIPASVNLTAFLLILRGDFGRGGSATSGMVTLSNLGVDGLTSSGGPSTGLSVASAFIFPPPDNGPIAFDKAVNSFSIDALDHSGTVTSIDVAFVLFSPVAVPEPHINALLLTGLCLLGATRRQRAAYWRASHVFGQIDQDG